MENHVFYLPNLIPNHFATLSRNLGFDPDLVISSCGFTNEELNNPFAFDIADKVFALMAGVKKLIGKPHIGFVLGSQPFHPSYWGVAGYAYESAPNLGAVLDLVLLLSNGGDGEGHLIAGLAWQETEGCYYVRDAADNRWDCMPDYMEYWLLITFGLFRHYTGQNLSPLSVSFSHSPRGPVKDYERLFGCPVHFGQPTTSFTFPAHWKEIEGVRRDDLMFASMLKVVGYYTRSVMTNTPMKAQVVHRLETALNNDRIPTMESVAQELAGSARNIQRQLKGEGTTFSQLWDQVRKTRAIVYLTNSTLSQDQISFALGFRGVSSFHHAFKRWTDMTPGEFRKRYINPVQFEHPFAGTKQVFGE